MSSKPLSKRHLRHLLDSGITREVINARGYHTVRDADELQRLGFRPRAWKRPFAPGLLIPLHGPRSGIVGYSYRPDTQWLHPSGKVTKYVGPDRRPLHVDIHPLMQSALDDTSRALFITEGHKKADAAASRGLPCLALSGVDSYQHRRRLANGRRSADSIPCAEWADIPMRRTFVIAYDSDVASNDKVQGARLRLTNFLKRHDAERVFWIDLPPAPDGSKVGLDDFFVTGGTVQDLRDLPRHLAFDQNQRSRAVR